MSKAEARLTRPPIAGGELTEAMTEAAALALCAARGEEPAGEQVRFIDGGMHSATFLEIARHDVRTVAEALAMRSQLKPDEDVVVTPAMIEAARRASDWVADLRDEEIAHILRAAIQSYQEGK